MKFDWKKAAGVLVLILVGFIGAALSNQNKDENEFEEMLKSASDCELEHEYEKRQLEWMKNGFGGNGKRTPEMERINKELSRRSAEKWENDPRRNTDPNYRWSDANRWDTD